MVAAFFHESAGTWNIPLSHQHNDT
jgi:hypothetical protein